MSAVYHDFENIELPGETATAGVTSAAALMSVAGVNVKSQTRRIGVLFTDSNATGGTYTFEQRTAGGGGVTAIGVITKPAASQIGKYLYKDVSVVLNEGNEVTVTGSAASGVVRMYILAERVAEVPGNQTNMVASA